MKKLDELWSYAVRNLIPVKYIEIVVFNYCYVWKNNDNKKHEPEILEQLICEKGDR